MAFQKFIIGCLFGSTALAFVSGCTQVKTMKDVQPNQFKPQTFGRFVPEREDDFTWENDKIAFRVYGPNSSAKGPASGVDAWFKSVDYPIVNKWYEEHLTRDLSYHVDHGEGHDVYHTGTSRGVGGTAVWVEGKPYPAGTFKTHKVLSNDGNTLAFELTYQWNTPLGVIDESKVISITMGSQLYHVDSSYMLNGQPANNLPIAIGLATHDEAAKVSKNESKGWISTWRDIQEQGVGTGVLVAPSAIQSIVHTPSNVKDESHIWIVTATNDTGLLSFKAGFGWEGAGEITTWGNWNEYLNVAATHK